jgi:hypothetical protein
MDVPVAVAPRRPNGTLDQPPAPPHSGPDTTTDSWGVTGLLGSGAAGGDYGNLFTKPISWEFDFFRQNGPWRYGIGTTASSFKMKQPYQDELEWGFHQFYVFGTRSFNTSGVLRPFVQLRAGVARLHPRSTLFIMKPLPTCHRSTSRPTDRAPRGKGSWASDIPKTIQETDVRVRLRIGNQTGPVVTTWV